ncbi:pyridine nucleotide-disulfide oxidoreductase [Microtetraspora sp. NBRC 13810]|uniref:NAD(P)/FAD-dependent oxidoreductase n=1 Tax=Microtetraspora sp. NBRC 13810 TaxID=3030990 RepID=UPI0024A3D38F|nr:FAD-dependent oxidoreductase [Microtetraspora sp. NBRC 13810]GLW11281.1 pyridine nucleotide-disulfide oxidoreductase [Microtetraspora sp. NBRC 13810]
MTTEKIVVVGASLAGLRAAEALRELGFTGAVTLIGDEPHHPYDRPPLSKAVLAGRLSTAHTQLPQLRRLDAEWLLGVAATGLDLHRRQVALADGRRVGFDKLLITTGTRARRWRDPVESALTGVHLLRTREDAERLRAALTARPRRVLVVGGGFTGSEVASLCRDLDLAVTLAHRDGAPLAGALGAAVGGFATGLQREAGVDLRLNTTVERLEGDASGRLRRARLSDGTALEADVAVVALGAVGNVEWLAGSGLAADGRGLLCDARCRARTADGGVAEAIYAAGDVARWPHPLYDGRLVRLDHWGNAVAQARVAAHNMLHRAVDHREHRELPTFWSNQFGVNLKSVGLTAGADQVVINQGSLDARKFVAAHGRRGRLVAAVAVDSPRVLDGYAALIEARVPFPPTINATDGPAGPPHPVPAAFPGGHAVPAGGHHREDDHDHR